VRRRRNEPRALKLNLPGKRGSFTSSKTCGWCALAEDKRAEEACCSEKEVKSKMSE